MGTKRSGLTLKGQTWGKDVIVEITHEPDSIAGSVDIARVYVVGHGESAASNPVAVLVLQ